MGEACCTNGKDEKCLQILVGKTEGQRKLEDPSVDGRTILQLILGKLVGNYGQDSG
jgi:hypothetical protein